MWLKESCMNSYQVQWMTLRAYYLTTTRDEYLTILPSAGVEDFQHCDQIFLAPEQVSNFMEEFLMSQLHSSLSSFQEIPETTFS